MLIVTMVYSSSPLLTDFVFICLINMNDSVMSTIFKLQIILLKLFRILVMLFVC